MKKPILMFGAFLLIAAVAFVYAVQQWATDSIPLSIKRYIPRVNNTANTTTTATIHNSAGSVQFEFKPANPYLLKGSNGDAHFELRITGKSLPNATRKAMNLVLVIDRSGSMGSENKLENVKNAAVAILDQMNPTDRLALVVYDDHVQTLLHSTPLENKAQVRELIQSLTPGGSTNLCGGLEAGFAEIRSSFNPRSVNRVLLLSDGLANVGVVDPEQIQLVAKKIRDASVSVSALGVGIDYNENLMANIADVSGGNYYYVSQDLDMAHVFRQEWNLMQNLVATNAVASLDLNKGVTAVDVAGYPWHMEGTQLKINVPDVYSGESKRILIHLRAPAHRAELVKLGKGRFTFTDMTSPEPRPVQIAFEPSIHITESETIVQKNVDSAVAAKVASTEASSVMDEAYRKWEAGEADAAEELASRAKSQLEALGYVQNAPQAQRYESFLRDLKAPASPQRKKDILKKQKEIERKSVQFDAQ